MKKLVPFIVIFAIVSIIIALFLATASTQGMIVVKEGNIKRVPLKMELGKHQDSDCGMVIDELKYASQVVAPDGKTWFFHDHGGFIKWLEDKSFKDEAIIWVMSRDSKIWIDARVATYSMSETTPMGYGFGAYEVENSKHIDFKTMKLRVLRGETMNNPHIRQQLLDK